MRIGCAVAVMFLTTVGCGAQEENVSANVRAEVEAARQASRRGAATFLDRSQSEAARLAAVANLDAFVDRGDATAALEIVRDPAEPVAVRVRALQLALHEIEQDQELVEELLGLLASPETPAPLRHAMADAGRVLLITGTGTARGDEIMAVMRSMSRDPDPQIRALALGMLAAQNDDATQKILADDLRNPNEQLVPPEHAAAMLALHPDGDTLPALREVLASPPNTAAQLHAIDALGGDVQSHDALERLATNSAAANEVRIAAAGALSGNAPEKFVDAAAKIVADPRASDELRVFAIKAVQLYQQQKSAVAPSAATADERAFRTAVQRLRNAPSPAVRNAARQYLAPPPAPPKP